MKDDGSTLLDNLQSLFRAPEAASRNPSTRKPLLVCLRVSMLLSKYRWTWSPAVPDGDMEVLSVAHISGSVVRQVLRVVSCDACKTCLTSEVLLSANVFIYFKECSDTEQSLTYPSEKLVETVGTAVTLMESIMAEATHLNSVEQHITAAIKSTIDFKWIRCSACSLHHQ
ncbi:uncharacterized protein LOC111862951 isoform X2 [Cryptotermes secundus]|uniref:uncharacterized protein LOC111862951 isoform X2 n=1 Tax=Cryptotermes secundus TaxID=105785 RepID=UPI001454CEB4|nr:uncharacterized protein LOC111862951 isoform X2 [Cryptotermes secundus]